MSIKADMIWRFLQDRKKSKEWLASEIGCSLATVDRVLAGKTPNAETLVKLATLMGRKVEDLVTLKAG